MPDKNEEFIENKMDKNFPIASGTQSRMIFKGKSDKSFRYYIS